MHRTTNKEEPTAQLERVSHNPAILSSKDTQKTCRSQIVNSARTWRLGIANRARISSYISASASKSARRTQNFRARVGLLPSSPNPPQFCLSQIPIVNSVRIWRLGIARVATLVAQCALKIFALDGVSYIPPVAHHQNRL